MTTAQLELPAPRVLVSTAALRGPLAVATALLAGLLVPGMLGAGQLSLVASGLADAVAVLSIVLLTGLGGQLSLAQAAFMGVGAIVAAHLAHDAGLPAPLAMLGGALAAVPVGLVVALPAMRLGGVELAVVTLALGQLVQEVFLRAPVNGGSGDGVPMPRPGFATGDAAFVRLEAVVVVAVAVGCVLLQARRTGRALALLRRSEGAARALGIDTVRLRLGIFALSAFMAGLAGTLLAAAAGTATPSSYGPFDSVGLLAVAVIGGVTSVPGAVAGGLLRACAPAWVARLPLGVAPPDLAATVLGVGLVLGLVLRVPPSTRRARPRAVAEAA